MTEELNNKPLTIFLVDDDTFLLDTYARKFKAAGHTVEVGAHADTVLEKFEGGIKPDIVILDVVMPKMDGIELVAELKKRNLLDPKTAIVILSNQGEPNDIERAKQVGVDGYIVKATTLPSEVVTEVISIYNGKHN